MTELKDYQVKVKFIYSDTVTVRAMSREGVEEKALSQVEESYESYDDCDIKEINEQGEAV